jgi:hypothetical protein
VITFFTTAKAFRGHSAVIQRNALKSWTLLHPDVEVILFGDDEGAAEACRELGLRHEFHVEHHESGMKYLNYMFARAQQIARHDYLCYSNCDIVLMDDFWKAFEKVAAWRKRFLLVGRRWDTDVTQPIDFADPHWASNLRGLALSTGFHQSPGWIDFFAFSKGLYGHVPPLVVGRSYWDNWLVWTAISARVPVVDSTDFVVPVHQNHEYGYHPQGKWGTGADPLAKRNEELRGDSAGTVLDSTHRLTADGRIHRTLFRRLIAQPSSPGEFWFAVKRVTFPWRNRLGLRRKSFRKLWARPAKPGAAGSNGGYQA